MAQFEVSTAKLTEEANQLRNLKKQLEQECANMKSIAASYLNMWEGEAKQAFVNSANKNINLLNAFTNNMEKFAQALEQGASTYDAGEKEAVRIANVKGQ